MLLNGHHSDLTVTHAGVSGTVLDDLSGTYKTFAEAVKEAISNAYDADASQVVLRFGPDFSSLEIIDDGAGMNPRQVLREYIRVGRSVDAQRKSPSGRRERIGGKGIGSLAPARYCRALTLQTKSSLPLAEAVDVVVPEDGRLALSTVFPYAPLTDDVLALFDAIRYQGPEGPSFAIARGDTLILPPGPGTLSYCIAAERVWLRARIDFTRLRDLGERITLDRLRDLWDIQLVPAHEREWPTSGTTITLQGLEEFVTRDLRAPGKAGARNMVSRSGLERFQWTLGKLCPVPVRNIKGELNRLPGAAARLLTAGDALRVYVVPPGAPLDPKPLTREVFLPGEPMSAAESPLCQVIDVDQVWEADGIRIRGYVLGSPTIIYPAELRGISVRVKGVELGHPSLFGSEALVSGPQHVALTNHITGELHVEGVDARRDILPGREGLYPESPVYRAIRRLLAGTDATLGGILRDVVGEILLRSESNASAQNLIKRLTTRRDAMLDASLAIARVEHMSDTFMERLLTPVDDDSRVLDMCPEVEVRPEGRLAAYSVKYHHNLTDDYHIDYQGRQLILNSKAAFLANTLDLGGLSFTLHLVEAPKVRKFCEVDPDARKLYVNWAHPARGAFGDASYIKHCLAAAVTGIPQEDLHLYVSLLVARN